MNARSAAPLLVFGALWRSLGLQPAGRRVLASLDDPDETTRTMAGILVVKAGRRAIPLLQESMNKCRNLPMVIRLAADVGAHELVPQIRQFADAADPRVAAAARDALRLLASSA